MKTTLLNFNRCLLTAILAGLSTVSVATSECADWNSSHPTWIWCDDFESGSITIGNGQYFDFNNGNGSFSTASGTGINNSYAMKANWQSGQVDAGFLHLVFGRNPIGNNGVRDTQDFREIYYRIFVRTQAGWNGDNSGKLSRTTVFSASNWSQAMIAHIWSSDTVNAALAMDPVGCVNASGNVACSGYNDFSNMQWLGRKDGNTAVFSSANADKWQCIETHVKLNDPGSSNGIQEMWIDDQLEVSSINLDFTGTYTDYAINAVFLENYWNAGGSPKAQARFIDNFVVSTSRIGCNVSGAVAAPNPPSSVTVN